MHRGTWIWQQDNLGAGLARKHDGLSLSEQTITFSPGWNTIWSSYRLADCQEWKPVTNPVPSQLGPQSPKALCKGWIPFWTESESQRRQPVVVGRLDVGAMLDEQVEYGRLTVPQR